MRKGFVSFYVFFKNGFSVTLIGTNGADVDGGGIPNKLGVEVEPRKPSEGLLADSAAEVVLFDENKLGPVAVVVRLLPKSEFDAGCFSAYFSGFSIPKLGVSPDFTNTEVFS